MRVQGIALRPLAGLSGHARQHRHRWQSSRQPIIAASCFILVRCLTCNKVTQKVTTFTLPAIVIYTWGLPTNDPAMFPLLLLISTSVLLSVRGCVCRVFHTCVLFLDRPLNWQAANGCCAFYICRSTGFETLPRILRTHLPAESWA